MRKIMKMLKQSLTGAACLGVLAAVMGLMISPATRAQMAETPRLRVSGSSLTATLKFMEIVN